MCKDHKKLWRAVDQTAKKEGISASALAKKAKLDATTFNKSKRVGRDGRERWPSMESIARVLDATGADWGTLKGALAEAGAEIDESES